MSICDGCIHDEVCGLEDNHEEAMTFCADMKPKDVLDKIRAEIVQIPTISFNANDIYKADVLQIIDKYRKERMNGNS